MIQHVRHAIASEINSFWERLTWWVADVRWRGGEGQINLQHEGGKLGFHNFLHSAFSEEVSFKWLCNLFISDGKQDAEMFSVKEQFHILLRVLVVGMVRVLVVGIRTIPCRLCTVQHKAKDINSTPF